MEKVYRKGDTDKFFGESSGLMYTRDEVAEINGDYWHCHPSGQPVIEVAELEPEPPATSLNEEGYYDTRVHRGYPKYPYADGSKSKGNPGY